MLYAVAVCVWVGATSHCHLVMANNYSPTGLFVPDRQECIDMARRQNVGQPKDKPLYVCMENDSNTWVIGQGWRPVEPQ